MTPGHEISPVGSVLSRPPHSLVGRNSRGQWVVREHHARYGGLFNSRAEALRVALRELGESPSAIVLVTDVLELFGAPTDAGTASPNHISLCDAYDKAPGPSLRTYGLRNTSQFGRTEPSLNHLGEKSHVYSGTPRGDGSTLE
jgi:hypothetical protein